MTDQLTVTFKRPEDETPPFNRPIIAIMRGSTMSGGGWRPYHQVIQVRVTELDPDGSAVEGGMMLRELQTGVSKWADLQFMLKDSEGEGCGWYSNSIVWWAEVPPVSDDTPEAA